MNRVQKRLSLNPPVSRPSFFVRKKRTKILSCFSVHSMRNVRDPGGVDTGRSRVWWRSDHSPNSGLTDPGLRSNIATEYARRGVYTVGDEDDAVAPGSVTRVV